MTYDLLKVSKAPLFMCLKCPLCSNLVHEATTISECLHTFCRDCIYQELGEEESDSCPICNVNLGCSPLEKLRADRQLDDVRAKIFPAKLKKRKVIDDDFDHDSPAPAKRKERSLSSLGIGVPPSANPGFVKRKTKSVTRRSSIATSRDTSTDNDSVEKQTDSVVKSEVDTEVEHFERGCAQDIGSTDHFILETTEEACAFVKTEPTFDEDQEINEAKLVQKLEMLGSSRKVLPSTGHQSTGHDPSSTGKGQSKFSTENLKASSTRARRAQGTGLVDEHRVLPGAEKYDTQDRKLPASFAVVRERTGKGVKRRSALAKLAEIAVDQAVKEIDPPIFHVPRAPRGRGALENSKLPAKVENLDQNLQERSTLSPAAPLIHAIPPPPLFKSSSTIDKVPLVRNFSLQERRPVIDTKSSSSLKQKERNAGFWFVLQAADSQIGTSALPQLSARYLRIKDGKLPISVVKKYLMKKLHLNNENEVEITCRGQPVVPNLPLENVRSIWFATMPTSSSISSMKENHVAEVKCRRESHCCADDYLMVLTYGRHRKPM